MFKVSSMMSAAMMMNLTAAQQSEYVVSRTIRPLYQESVKTWDPRNDASLQEYGALRQKAIDSYDLHKIIKLETVRNSDYSLFQKLIQKYSEKAFKNNARAANTFRAGSLSSQQQAAAPPLSAASLLGDLQSAQAYESGYAWQTMQTSYALAPSAAQDQELKEDEAAYVKSLNDALQDGRDYQQLIYDYGSRNDQSKQFSKKEYAYENAVKAAKIYDTQYRENKSHLRYYLWPQKRQVFLDYLAYKEAQHARNLRMACTTPNKPVLNGDSTVTGDHKFIFSFDHSHNYHDKFYEILEYSHYESPNWAIASCWMARKDDWKFHDIPIDSDYPNSSKTHTFIAQGIEDHHHDAYHENVYFRVRAKNKCGTVGEWSDAVFYSPKQVGGKTLWTRQKQITVDEWNYVKATQCQKTTGERTVGKSMTNEQDLQVASLEDWSKANGKRMRDLSKAEKLAALSEIQAAADLANGIGGGIGAGSSLLDQAVGAANNGIGGGSANTGGSSFLDKVVAAGNDAAKNNDVKVSSSSGRSSFLDRAEAAGKKAAEDNGVTSKKASTKKRSSLLDRAIGAGKKASKKNGFGF